MDHHDMLLSFEFHDQYLQCCWIYSNKDGFKMYIIISIAFFMQYMGLYVFNWPIQVQVD